jgi:two-component system chemotaxis response regulator CheB
MNKNAIIVIGASAGGPRILKQIFTNLPKLNCSVILVQHMPQFINDSIAQSLDACSQMSVCIARDGELLKPGMVYVAPSEVHTTVLHNQIIKLGGTERVNYVCPSVDVTLRSLVHESGTAFAGIILTGMGRDGADGICYLKSIGGMTIAQNQVTSVIFGMPKEAIDTGCIDWVLSPEEIHQKMIDFAGTAVGPFRHPAASVKKTHQ